MTAMDGLQLAFQIARRKAEAPVDILVAGGITRAEAWAQKVVASQIASEIKFEIMRWGGAKE